MAESFAEIISGLRRERGLSQRAAAADLRVSQALLSHYENETREPGLAFLRRACRYYGVTADYLLGLSGERGGGAERKTLAEALDTLEALSARIKQTMEETEP